MNTGYRYGLVFARRDGARDDEGDDAGDAPGQTPRTETPSSLPRSSRARSCRSEPAAMKMSAHPASRQDDKQHQRCDRNRDLKVQRSPGVRSDERRPVALGEVDDERPDDVAERHPHHRDERR